MTRVAAIIPARMGSSRFPGKPLLDFRGLPMVEHVRRRALLAGIFSDVVVATCDEEIAQAIRRYRGDVIMTSSAHVAATDRVAEAMERINCTHVVNLQGDEILVLPEDLKRLAATIDATPLITAWNAIASIDQAEELSDRSIVKCVVSRSDRIMACARDFSKLAVDGTSFAPVQKILGIIAFERQFLGQYSSLGRTPIEVSESIDQSRIVEHDIVLQGVRFTRGYPGINEPREVALVEDFLKTDPRQQSALAKVVDFGGLGG